MLFEASGETHRISNLLRACKKKHSVPYRTGCPGATIPGNQDIVEPGILPSLRQHDDDRSTRSEKHCLDQILVYGNLIRRSRKDDYVTQLGCCGEAIACVRIGVLNDMKLCGNAGNCCSSTSACASGSRPALGIRKIGAAMKTER